MTSLTHHFSLRKGDDSSGTKSKGGRRAVPVETGNQI
jgi:hypothetical protein